MSQKTSFLSLISIAAVLILLHFFGMLYTHSDVLVSTLKERVNVLIELEDEMTNDEKSALISELQSNVAIIGETVRFVDKKEAVALVSGQFENISQEDSPFKNSVLFNLKSAHYNQEFLEDLKGHLIDRDYISDVFYQNDLFGSLKKNIDRFSFALLIGGLLLLIFVVIIIFNTVRLSLINDAQKIKTMSLVGAKWSHIRGPYFKSALITGAIASIIAIVVSLLMFYSISSAISGLETFIIMKWTFIVSLTILLIGIMVPLTATGSIVNNYLRKTTYD